MRLIKCHVDNFGTLSGYDIVFDKNITVISEKNGFGKTTLAAFIKNMLYGMSDTKKTELSLNDRAKYTPWQGGRFGGYIILEVNINGKARRIRIDRSFGKKASEDEFSVTDDATGEKLNELSAKIGEELFGIDADAFAKSVYLPQERKAEAAGGKKGSKPGNTSIAAKLTDLLEQSDDLGSLEPAIAALDKKRLYYYTNKGGGEINKIEKLISEKENEYNKALQESKELDELTKEIDTGKNALSEKQAEREKLICRISPLEEKLKTERGELIKQEEARKLISEQYKKLKEKADQADKEYKTLLDSFLGKEPEQQTIDELSSIAIEISGIKQNSKSTELSQVEAEKYFELNSRFAPSSSENAGKSSGGSSSDSSNENSSGSSSKSNEGSDDIAHLAKELLEKDRAAGKAESKKHIYAALIIPALILMLCGGIASGIPLLLKAVLIISGAALAVFAVAMLISLSKNAPSKEILQAIRRFYPEYSPKKTTSHSEMILRLRDDHSEYSRLTKRKAELEGSRIDSEKRLDELISKLKNRLYSLGMTDIKAFDDDSINTAIQSVKERAQRIKEKASLRDDAKNELQAFKAEKSAYLSLDDGEKENAIRQAQSEFDALKKDLAAIEMAISDIKTALTKAETNCKRISDSASDAYTLDAELEQYRSQKAEMKKKHDAIIKTIDYLNEAKKLLSGRYLDGMKKSFNDLMSFVCGLSTDKKPHEIAANAINADGTDCTDGAAGTVSTDGANSADGADGADSADGAYSKESERAGNASDIDALWKIDPELNITAGTETGVHGYDSFSLGYKDLMDICLHLALSDALFKDEKPFMILDDPFTNLDEDKLKNALDILKQISSDRQIIYLVCHESRLPK